MTTPIVTIRPHIDARDLDVYDEWTRDDLVRELARRDGIDADSAESFRVADEALAYADEGLTAANALLAEVFVWLETTDEIGPIGEDLYERIDEWLDQWDADRLAADAERAYERRQER